MDKRTIVFSCIDTTEGTFYLQNVGIEENDVFKKLKRQGIEFNTHISDEELMLILSSAIGNKYTIEGIFAINNHYNEDQKEINRIKNNIRLKSKFKGLTEIQHCEPVELDFDESVLTECINKRNYIDLLNEQIRTLENDIQYKRYEIDNKKQQLHDLSIQVKTLENTQRDIRVANVKYESLKEQINNLSNECNEIMSKRDIMMNNIRNEAMRDIENHKKTANENLEKIISRYKKGIVKLKEVDGEIKSIESALNQKKDELSEITFYLKYKSDVNMLNEFIKEYHVDFKRLRQILGPANEFRQQYNIM